jgi:hypothetical protein
MPDYPREIYLDEESEEKLISLLDDYLFNHFAERSGHIDDLMLWQKDYWAKPSTKKVVFPFTNAASIVIPLGAIAVEAIVSRTDTQLFGLPQLVTAISVSPEWEPATEPVEKYMDYELQEKSRIRRPLVDCSLEWAKFGTCIGKVGYEKVVKVAIREIGGVEEEFDVVVKDGPVTSCVSDSRFLMPHGSMDPNSAPWCGEEHSMSPYEMMNLERAGFFRPGTVIDEYDPDGDISPNPDKWSKLHSYFFNMGTHTTGQETGRKFTDNQAELENTKPVWPSQVDWVEVKLAFNTDKNPENRQKEIVVHYHSASRTIMSIRHNWNVDLHREYRVAQYFPVEHRWRGIGILKMTEQFQREITTQHRQRLDNATLANMRMIKVNRMAGYGPREPIFPGKMWVVDDIKDVDTFQLGEIYPSAYNNEQASLLYNQQRTGVNEVTLGMPQVGTPGTATSDLARIQEGNKKFDFSYGNFKVFVNDIIMDNACVIQQFGPRRLSYLDTQENGKLVKTFFEMPAEFIRDGLIIQLKAVGQQQNKIIDRQNWAQLSQFFTSYYTGLLQLAMPLGDPNLIAAISKKGLVGANEAMRQLLETFDTRNIPKFIVHEIEAILNGAAQGGPPNPAGNTNGNGNGGGGNNGSNRINPTAGMDILSQIMSGSGGR